MTREPVSAVGGGGCLVRLKVTTRSSKTRLSGYYGDAVKVCCAAPPVDNRANAEIIGFFSELFKIPASGIRIVSGGTSHNKKIFLPVPPAVFLSRTGL